MEAAAGLLSRAFASATVDAPDDIAEAVSPRCLAQIGRDLVRVGESLHIIRMMGGRVRLVPASTWYWEGDADPATWLCTATAYGPSGSSTWRVPMDSVVFAAWGSPTARPYHGLGPATWAAETARLSANAERSLADEAGGPVAALLTVPEGNDAGSDDDDDALAGLRSPTSRRRAAGRCCWRRLRAATARARARAPNGIGIPRHLHPAPTDAMVKLADVRVRPGPGCGRVLSGPVRR